jgi:hypothetical protein
MKHYSGFAGALMLLAGLSSSGDAEAMRCGNRLVSTGDSTYKVRSICGEPDDAQQRVELRTVRHRVRKPCVVDDKKTFCEGFVERIIEVVIEEWIYDLGRNYFVRYLTFEQGRLVHIDTGHYGQKE